VKKTGDGWGGGAKKAEINKQACGIVDVLLLLHQRKKDRKKVGLDPSIMNVCVSASVDFSCPRASISMIIITIVRFHLS